MRKTGSVILLPSRAGGGEAREEVEESSEEKAVVGVVFFTGSGELSLDDVEWSCNLVIGLGGLSSWSESEEEEEWSGGSVLGAGACVMVSTGFKIEFPSSFELLSFLSILPS